LNLPRKSAEIQMGMGVYQGGKQGCFIMVPGWSFRPLAAEERKRSYVQDGTFGHHHSAIFDCGLGYGNDQPGSVKNRTGVTPAGRLGGAGTGRIEVDVSSGHSFLSLVHIQPKG